MRAAYLDADLNDPDAMLAAAAGTLDFTRPVAIMLIAVLHMVDDQTVQPIVDRLMAACPSGSFLAISHPASDVDSGRSAAAAKHFNATAGQKMTLRDRAAVIRLFDGLDLLEPGVTRVAGWRPDSAVEAATPASPWGGGGAQAVARTRGVRGPRCQGPRCQGAPAASWPACQTAATRGTPGR